MLELLMHAEARERCGDWHSRSEQRDTVRWGSEYAEYLGRSVNRCLAGSLSFVPFVQPQLGCGSRAIAGAQAWNR